MFEGIARGEYMLLAWLTTAEVPYAEPGLIRQFSAQVKAIAVAEGEKVNVVIGSLLKLDTR